MSNLKGLYSVFLFATVAVSLVAPRGYSVGFFLISLSGLMLWTCSREKLLDDKNRWLILPCLIYAVGETAIGLMHHWGWRMVDPYAPFVLLIFGVWGIRKYRPNTMYFWYGLGFGAIGAGVISGYQAALGHRSFGFMLAIQFGNASLLMGVLCLVRLLMVRGNRWMDVLMSVGFLAGMAGSIWSQTRGGWVAVILVFVWMVRVATLTLPLIKRLGVAVVLLCVLAIPAIQTNGIVQNRVKMAVHELDDYIESKKQGSAVGARLGMWEFAIRDIHTAPLLGHGVEGWILSRDEGVASGALEPVMKSFTHLHNDFLDVLYKNGFIGLALLLLLYWLPMLMFFKPYLHSYGAEVKALAMGGMVLPMMYMDFGLTQTFLSHNSGRMIFVSLLMCLGALLLNEAQEE